MASLERGDVRACRRYETSSKEDVREAMMPIKVERTLFKIGEGGFAVTLPKAWVRYYNLKPGDKVEIVANESLIIRVKDKANNRIEGLTDSNH